MFYFFSGDFMVVIVLSVPENSMLAKYTPFFVFSSTVLS
ncbi:hypothetical protein EPIR_2848 [Erwinia piriflorinigrans CFBP 5888]|uniref:Uncharacterized protein n=1 Tax=Erwinia piriflorinigrans CFBP 5888 TaxID=1161919 RepID=V5ZBC2_9GAMM|nr:hypothetical protein EPIR_2848 [Erwinia piriflorinigrans CFBP 5888]